jgi:hypothetical protein
MVVGMVDEGDAVTTPAHAPAGEHWVPVGPGPAVPGLELGALLARGGTSEVWAAVSLDDGRRVAVKVVQADAALVEAAAREAAVSAAAASANVVAVEACLELPDGRVALVMPHLLGGALDALVRARGHLSPGEVVTVLAPVASALGRLHDLGVVHGDVSPGNVLLDLDGRPVLGDLGLGHVVGEVVAGVWGTDGYVAPEVLLGGDPTAASDVYGLGALGWLCLSGTVPGPPGLRPELSEVCRAGEGSEALVAALALAVSADPGDRPGAHELAWLLFGAAEAEPLRLVQGDDEVSAVTYRLRAAAGRPPASSARRRWFASRVPNRSPGQPPEHPTRGWRSARGRHATDRVRREWGGGERRRPLEPRRAPTVLAIVLLVPALVALLVLAVGVLGPEGDSAGATPHDAPVGSPSTPAADPRLDADAPRSRPQELLAVLAEARAAAWREATPALLGEADAPRSAAAVSDAEAVSEVARAGVRYTGLRYSVAEVRTVSASLGRAVLLARVDAGRYAVTGPAGSTSRAAVQGTTVLVDLVHTDVGWRVSDVRAAP